LPGTTGWSTRFGGCPTVLWNPQVQNSDASFGVRTNQFGFTIIGTSGLVIVVEACTNLANPTWSPVGTNTLTGGSSYFSDPLWTNYSARFYRLRPGLTVTEFRYMITASGKITITGYTGSGRAVTIPDTINALPVTSIGSSAFYGCTNLSAITVDALNSAYSSVDGVLFNKSQTTLIQCPGGKAGSYTIPNSVTSIGIGAFSHCTGLTNVTIPNSVKYIGEGAFNSCINLTSVTIPNSVTSIGSYAFSGCTSLTNVTIPNSVTSIGSYAFSDCTSLSAITVDASNSFYSSVEGVLFDKSQTTLIECPGGKAGSYTIPNSVTNIGTRAFFGCTSLASVTIPNSVTSIGELAFSGCTSLTNVTIPNSVTSIGDQAFDSCTSLASVTIPNSVTSIGSYAFSRCTSLRNVTIPNSVTSIGDQAFGSCTSLTAFAVDATNSFYSSLDGVLFNKSQTTLIQYPGGRVGSYMIPDSVTNIGGWAFLWCTSLTIVTISNSVTNIGQAAFWGCTNLTSVTIGYSVTSIGQGAFAFCDSLTGVYFQGNAPSGGYDAFYFADKATVYYLPGTTWWGVTFGGRPTAVWQPRMQTGDASFGVRTNQFGFTISWASGRVVVVEACTDLANPTWSPLQTNTLTGDSLYFSDPEWTNYPGRFYRVSIP